MNMNHYKSPPRDPDIEAEIYFFTEEEGGRKKPAYSGYRPDHDFGVKDMINGAQHEYQQTKAVNPGEKANALLWLTVPELQDKRLFINKEFTIQEGARIVGSGKITRIINKELINT